MSETAQTREDGSPLRRGWTTGACATAATRSALLALLTGSFEDPVTITLPGGQRPAFALAEETRGDGFAQAGIIKDAGDDPDVTHGALVLSRVEPGPAGSGVRFRAGEGVGTVTKPGLPLPVGEPAINPVPRKMMREVIEALAAEHGIAPDFAVTVSVRDGERIASKTWNPRLGIVGGLSILGTTGIVIPYSCSAWIASIHRGVDVARAMGLSHVVGSTGDTSEKAAMSRLDLPIEAYLDMGDFVGGLLKYLRVHPVPRLTIAGGFAKLSKLAQGAMDLHSARGTVDLEALAMMLADLGASPQMVERARGANTANEVQVLAREAGLPLADIVARRARDAAQGVVGEAVSVDVLVVDRAGIIVGESG
ncbi:cobalt-precorrin-5B C(1)-methyltransferase [Youhaiella tibetensis]|uniref:Cobalt-precorrin-5B C(1)-methyltransferase n=1 Tax=Paradevosia tibetensis TaxID=1447062 RepID=A0A5B9DJ70_9HYPH|nr:cobalt-precorrin-5B (C(1))-methyltransferase [Youhaiella tibetensis]QEE18798.1 cobalt-precorrin-5B (C(1))-methyltransferase [Youhaiella tibetensis]GGF39053.1 cobalt-precorrin-5B C(1)-methyltransferase [Youhaiella tibetensis]